MLLSDLLNSSGNTEDERSPSSLSKESDEVAEEVGKVARMQGIARK